MLIERSDIRQKITMQDRFNMLKFAFTGKAKGPRGRGLLQTLQKFMPAYGEPPRRSTGDWIDMYNKSPRMNPIHQIASDVASTEFSIYKDKSAEAELQKHLLLNLLARPCPNVAITQYMLFYITQVYLMLPAGEAFWLKERNGFSIPTELWVIPPNWIIEIPTVHRRSFYICPIGNVEAGIIEVPENDMVYFKRPNVSNPYLRGIGRAECIGDEIETDEYMAKHQKRFFFNDATPRIVGQMPGAEQTEIERTEELWQQKYGGVGNSHKVAWLNWDAKLEVIKQNYDEMDFIESRRYLRDSANQHFGIPPELMGILENSNRATISAAYYIYAKNVLRKELKFIADAINIQLLPDFKQDGYFAFENVVPDDDEFKLKKSTEGLKNGALLIDEWRIENGYEPLPNGQGQMFVMMGNSAINDGIEQQSADNSNDNNEQNVNEQTSNENEESKSKSVKKNEITLSKENIWYIMDKAAVDREKDYVKALKKFFQGQQDRVNQSIGKQYKSDGNNIDLKIDWGFENKKLLETMKPLWESTFNDGVTNASELFDMRINFNTMNERFTEWISEHGAEQVQNINKTTKNAIVKTLKEGIEQGESIPKLRDRVSSVFDKAKKHRADVVAKTESHSTMCHGSYMSYIDVGVEKKQWYTSKDDRVRKLHIDIDEEIVAIDKPFSNGLMYPGDASGPPEEICCCRCTLLPYLD